MYAKVATDTALDRTFDYLIPAEMAEMAKPGSRVKVTFNGRIVLGYILSLTDRTDFDGEVKPIIQIIGNRPWLSKSILDLAGWMSAYYLAPIEMCLQAVLPAPVRSAGSNGFVVRNFICLPSCEAAVGLDRTKKLTQRKKRVIDLLAESGSMALSEFASYAHTTPTFLKKMSQEGLVEIFEKRIRRDPLAGKTYLPVTPPLLNEAQSAAVDIICRAVDTVSDRNAPSPKPILLFGVTASGKTEVYLNAIEHTLHSGMSAIVLIPEISLTPQTVRRFASRFGPVTAVLHSRLSDGERHDEWHRIFSGEAKVVVGPRSAVFAPIESPGLIIVDEEHEPTYKQDETPHYNARDVAVMRGRFDHCAVVLGSATPSLESWHNAASGKYVMAEMPVRASSEMSRPRTMLVDMRKETTGNNGVPPVFSEPLIEAIRERLSLGEQTMLFLNRRGYSPRVQCPKCGHVETCEQCSVGMTYHLDGNFLKCHVCGSEKTVPVKCPSCGNTYLKFAGIGTQRIETIARKLFPSARIERMDADTTSRKSSHEDILTRFMTGDTDILIGTQMIAKGLDFPNVTLAGIINADASLYIPDLRASERTFQLIAQMSGRTGRGIIPGDVYIQTMTPEHPAIKCASNEDYRSFAEQELRSRKELDFPPISRCTLFTFSGEDRDCVESFSNKFSVLVRNTLGPHAALRGPTPAPIEKVKSMWRFQLTIFYHNPSMIIPAMKRIMTTVRTQKKVRVSVNVDAASAF